MTPDRPQPTREQLTLCAHDLRGVLTIIAGYADMLRREDVSADERGRALDGISDAVRRADQLLADTLAGRSHPVSGTETVDLGIIAHHAAADARAAFGREVRVTVEGLPTVADDAVALSRVFDNLLNNAAKYAPNGPVDVRVAESDGHVIIEVADRGPGIPESDRERVLEPFARLDRDLDAPGTGLGLTVVVSVAERLGGRVETLDRDGGGTVVRVELPAAR